MSKERALRGLLATALLLLTLLGACLLVVPSSASALDCGGVDTSVIGGDACEGASTTSNDSATNPVISVLKFVMQVLMGAVGIAAVGALIYAGIMYASAGGESSQVQKAKTLIKDTVIGIVAFSFMIIILNFVIPGGVFGQQGVTGGGTVAHTPDESGGGGSGGGSSGGSTKTNTTLTIATWNVLYDNGASDIGSGAKEIAKAGADLIGFQELNFPASRSAIKDKLIDCGECKFAGYFPSGGASSGWNASETVSLVWRKDMFSKLDQGQIHVSSADGPANTGDKWITWVKLKDTKTGVVFYFADTHFVAKVRQLSSNSQIKQNYYNHLNKLVGFVSSKKEPVFITGDFNMAYNYDKDANHTYDGHSYSPMRRLNKYQLYSNWQYAKKSSMSIDYVWAPKVANVSYVSMKRWSKKMGSDHAPVEMTVKIYKE